MWIVEPNAYRDLETLGVGDEYRRPGQIFVSAPQIGFNIPPFRTSGPEWWVQRLLENNSRG